MSGIYIPGMEMPTKCGDCILDHKFFKWLECNKHVTGDMIKDGRRSPACPLIPVPDHGRLIDADALEEYFVNDPSCLTIFEAIKKLQGLPTIIPAEEDEE